MNAMSSPFLRWGAGALAVVAVLAALRMRPWQRTIPGESARRETLAVGFLPVTCHLTCPVTDYASKTSLATRFESQRFTDFPTVVETVKSGRLDATFMIAPLAMKLREQGVKVKITYLGHRDGSTVIVRKDLPAKSLKDLAGRVFAIPSKYSNQYLVIRKLMKDEGVDPGTFRFVELPPPHAARSQQGVRRPTFVGERTPRARTDGSARALYAKDIWPLSSRASSWSPNASLPSVRLLSAIWSAASRKAANGRTPTGSTLRGWWPRISGRTSR